MGDIIYLQTHSKYKNYNIIIKLQTNTTDACCVNHSFLDFTGALINFAVVTYAVHIKLVPKLL